MASKTKTLAEMMDGDINDDAGAKDAFHRKARAVLKALAGELGLDKNDVDIRSNKGGPAVSGEVVLHTDRFYLQVSQSTGPGEVIFRRCEGRKDFSGGRNHWAKAAELDDIAGFAERLTRELKLDDDADKEAPPAETERKDIPLGQLRRSPKNVRKVLPDPDTDRQLAANIERRGLLQNLIVYQAGDDIYEVAGGGRRLAALVSLGLLDDHLVPCLMAPEELAVELSTAENLRRSSMHPADEAEAFRLMVHDQGRRIEDVAAEFGFSARTVQQRLKLASLAPDLITKFRSGDIKLEWAMALTVTERHEDQENAWKQVSHLLEWEDRAAVIKSILSKEKIAGDEPIAIFVGLDAYKAAGGRVDEDLFSSPDCPSSMYLTDLPLLNRLAHEKLEEAAVKLREQWHWAEPRVNWEEREKWTSYSQEHGKVPPLPDDLAAEDQQIEERLEQLYENDDLSEDQKAEAALLEARSKEIEQWPAANIQFSDEVRGRAGCVVTINYAGNLRTIQGLVRREDKPKDSGDAEGTVSGRSGDTPATGADVGPSSAANGASTTDAAPAPRISEVLGRDIGSYRTLCLQAALAQDPDLARDLLLHILVKDVLRVGYWSKPSEISAQAAHLTSTQNDLDSLPATKEIADIRETLQLSFMMVLDEDQPVKLRDMLPEDKDRLFAACVALSLTMREARPDGRRNSMLDFIQAELGGDRVITDRWRPTAANFFGRIKGADALAIGREVLGEEWANRHRNDKKGPLCQTLEKAFAAGNDPVEGLGPDVRARAAAWLPPGMALAEVPEDDGSQPGADETVHELPAFLRDGDENADAEAA